MAMFFHLQEYMFPGYTISFCSKCSAEQEVQMLNPSKSGGKKMSCN